MSAFTIKFSRNDTWCARYLWGRLLCRQAARTLEFVLDKYSPDQRTQEKLEMVLNIIR